MQQIGQYVVSLTTVALISGLLLSLLKEGPGRTLMRMLSGILLAITLISPLTQITITIPDMTDFVSDYVQAGQDAAQQGNLMARETRTGRIKGALEEYICSRASAMGADLDVRIYLDEKEVPETVRITGMTDGRVQQEIQNMITEELGIRKENQEWIG